MGQQRQQVWHGAGKADLDNPACHRPDFRNFGKIVSQRCAVQGRQRACQLGTGCFGGNRAAVGPFPVPQAEDIAFAVVGHDPAVSQGGNDSSLRIEADQPFCRCGSQQASGGGKRGGCFRSRVRRSDDGKTQGSLILLPAGREGQGEGQSRGRNEETAEPGGHPPALADGPQFKKGAFKKGAFKKGRFRKARFGQKEARSPLFARDLRGSCGGGRVLYCSCRGDRGRRVDGLGKGDAKAVILNPCDPTFDPAVRRNMDGNGAAVHYRHHAFGHHAASRKITYCYRVLGRAGFQLSTDPNLRVLLDAATHALTVFDCVHNGYPLPPDRCTSASYVEE